MKILLAGGGTGGHFFPLIAVARELRSYAAEQRLVSMELTLMSNSPFDPSLLREEGIRFVKVPAGKLRRYVSLLNILDLFKTLFGIARALWYIFRNFPDVIFAKGGYASFPALLAGRIFRIPVVVHESDVVPGLVNSWAGKFADRVAISFSETARYFPGEKTALTGNPVRKDVLGGSVAEAEEVFGLERGVPTVLVFGGSQGAKKINDVLVDALPELTKEVQVIHQTGEKQFKEIRGRSRIVLEKTALARRYHPFAFLDAPLLRNASRASVLAVSRAGAGMIFEIAAWGLPSIVIPIIHAAQDHQRKNAYAYARTGAATVLEEANFTPHVLSAEIMRLVADPGARNEMKNAAQSFARIDAARKIAEEIIRIGIHD